MIFLLKFSGLIDRLTERVGKVMFWLVLVMTIVAATNASIRFAFNYSSNAFLEIQWYLFSAVFLLCAPYTLQRTEHVRIDVLSGRLSLPLVGESFKINEMSPNAGGLLRWPVKALLPLGFGLLALQGISEVIKRFAFLSGLIEDPNQKNKGPSPEEELAAAIAANAAKANAR